METVLPTWYTTLGSLLVGELWRNRGPYTLRSLRCNEVWLVMDQVSMRYNECVIMLQRDGACAGGDAAAAGRALLWWWRCHSGGSSWCSQELRHPLGEAGEGKPGWSLLGRYYCFPGSLIRGHFQRSETPFTTFVEHESPLKMSNKSKKIWCRKLEP